MTTLAIILLIAVGLAEIGSVERERTIKRLGLAKQLPPKHILYTLALLAFEFSAVALAVLTLV